MFHCLAFTHFCNAQISTVGKEFWVGFMENHGSGNALDIGMIVITASEDAVGVISYSGRSVNFNIRSGEQFIHRITNVDILHRTSGVVEQKGVFIQSSGKISVYAFNERIRSADGTVVLPANALGKDYIITSYFEVSDTRITNVNYPNLLGTVIDSYESTMLVVAVENNTRVEIIPTANTTSGQIQGVPFEITLNSGQSYQLKANQDLTGTRVKVIGANVNDCKNIAVFEGNKYTCIGNCGLAGDHLFQQSYPINTWGSEFLHVPFTGRTSGELLKIIASEPNTVVTINGNVAGTIGTGQFIARNFSHTETAAITANKPISVTSFAKSMDCNLPGFNSGMGDPFMLTYSPNQQLLRQVTFNAINLPVIASHYVNIIVGSGSVGKTFLDGQGIGGQFTAFPNNPNYSYAQVNINQGVHNLVNEDGFIGYVYGFGEMESYGYAVGASLDNLNFAVSADYGFEVEGEQVACLDYEGLWKIVPENELFEYFVWDFGDGSDQVEGQEVAHTFLNEGVYEVLIIASLSPESCDGQEEIRFEVRVEGFEGEISGPISVCPDIEEIEYEFLIEKEISKVEWEVEGGEIIETIDNKAIVRWGAANTAAKLFARAYNLEGCPGNQIEYDVRINNQIDSGTVLGEDDICFDGITAHTYTASNPLNGRGYEWFATNGEIIGSNLGPEVQINWIEENSQGSVWYREYSLINDDCEGISEALEVNVGQLFLVGVEDIVHVTCYGESSGEITIQIQGGIGPYQLEWNHDSSFNSTLATGLAAGIYEVKVTDQSGCERIIRNVEVTQPDILEVMDISLTETSCYGRSDGEAILTVMGGSLPYIINHPHQMQEDNVFVLRDLEGRLYELEVVDAEGCVLPVTFTIDSPEPLAVDVRVEKFACPGESNGILSAFPLGGVGPFRYFWSWDNSQGEQIFDISRGEYEVTVYDSRDCIGYGTGQMIESDPIVRMPTGFDPRDGILEGVSNCEISYDLLIYSRWGELIYKNNTGWDGQINGNAAPIGSYTFVLTYNYILNGEAKTGQTAGSFILVR
ncbi:PKD domain-containing protein [Belliella kenyensis]|uniref:PKD domain-containing protein n=1 Tax=Belliella kenyensis TaxID=1472724 RepID=A0ABV8EI61_9BACT|nr:PKD domain-containing protein [Belliella kenyensis]MCH7401908.1 PKD domain-containing protein [Belliella kenyensis]MDN3604408.1 PKD domain-containing protein [Belliella kenyensis]